MNPIDIKTRAILDESVKEWEGGLKRRLGRWELHTDLLPFMHQHLFNLPFIAIHSEHDYAYNRFVFTGYSPLFEHCEVGQKIPDYFFEITEIEGQATTFKAVKLDRSGEGFYKPGVVLVRCTAEGADCTISVGEASESTVLVGGAERRS